MEGTAMRNPQKDFFGTPRGAARRLLIALTIRIFLLLACSLPVQITMGRDYWSLYFILSSIIIWGVLGGIVTITLIVKRYIAGILLGWLIVIDLLANLFVLAWLLELGEPKAMFGIAITVIFLFYIVRGLLSQDLQDYFDEVKLRS